MEVFWDSSDSVTISLLVLYGYTSDLTNRESDTEWFVHWYSPKKYEKPILG